MLEDTILRAARAGMPPDDLAELRRPVPGHYKEAFRWGLTGEPPAQVELGSVQVRSMAAYACPDADYSLPSKGAIKDEKLELVELVGGQTSARITFDPDSVQVMVRDFMDAQERSCEEVMDLVHRNWARTRVVERKGMLPDFAVGDYVLEARVRQSGITPKLMNTWTGRRVVSKTGGHVYGVEDIITGRSREVHIARMRPYADASLNVTAELKEVFNNLKSQGELDMERIEGADLEADSEEDVVKVKWVGLDEEETTWEPVSTIYADAPKYTAAQLRKLRLTKEVRDDLKKKYGMKV